MRALRLRFELTVDVARVASRTGIADNADAPVEVGRAGDVLIAGAVLKGIANTV